MTLPMTPLNHDTPCLWGLWYPFQQHSLPISHTLAGFYLGGGGGGGENQGMSPPPAAKRKCFTPPPTSKKESKRMISLFIKEKMFICTAAAVRKAMRVIIIQQNLQCCFLVATSVNSFFKSASDGLVIWQFSYDGLKWYIDNLILSLV